MAMFKTHLMVLLGVVFVVSSGALKVSPEKEEDFLKVRQDGLKVGAFNIQNFGPSKMKKDWVIEILAEVSD